MDTVFCTQCGQLNVAEHKLCLYCAAALPDVQANTAGYAPPPAEQTPPPRPYFANDPGGAAYPGSGDAPPTMLFNAPPTNPQGLGNAPWQPPPAPQPQPPPAYGWQPDPYAQPQQPYPQSPYAPPPSPYAPPAPMPPGYQGVDAFGLPSYSAYAPPAATQYELAGRGERLGAAILDGLLAVPFVLVPMFIGAMLDEAAGNRETFSTLFYFLGYIAYLGVLAYYLTTEGASPGKKALGIRIIKTDTLQNGGFVTNCLARGVLPAILGGITCYIFTIIDILFIFGDEQRCLHDQMAGTIVVKKGSDYLKLT
jgi:uncharacterized RDD family membrane protein YckC